MELNRKEIAAYVRHNVEFYEERLQLALDKMERNRCSLHFADAELFDRIADAISDWCNDNEVDLDYWADFDDLIEGDEGIIWEE